MDPLDADLPTSATVADPSPHPAKIAPGGAFGRPPAVAEVTDDADGVDWTTDPSELGHGIDG
ncbi:hypothetical protein GCM10027290_24420 [Micromonospora sonneratiae]